MSELAFEIVTPGATALSESLRAFGYTPATAISDLIDNSISAGATKVWIRFTWNGADSYISILDNGKGMTSAELRDAMRPGCKDPREDRDLEDLGRFGIGLKTAAFSQCRSLSLISNTKESSIDIRRWDLDHISSTNEWQLLQSLRCNEYPEIERLKELGHGTVVLLENLDRLVGDSSPNSNRVRDMFLATAEQVHSHVSWTFHRFLSDSFNPLKILFVNSFSGEENEIEPIDPLASSHAASIPSPEETLFDNQNNEVVVQGFVLPHKDRLSETSFAQLSGPLGWTGHQGFFVYRGNRLLVAGGWLGLGEGKRWTKEQQFKLARLRIDITNSSDYAWQIDVKKSTAKPPIELCRRLTELAQRVRTDAKRILSQRAEYGPRQPQPKIIRIWSSRSSQSNRRYYLNRDHPLLKPLIQRSDLRPKLESVLRLIEETVPIDRIWLDYSSQPENTPAAFEGVPIDEVRNELQNAYSTLLSDGGLSPEEAKQALRTFDCYLCYHDEISNIG